MIRPRKHVASVGAARQGAFARRRRRGLTALIAAGALALMTAAGAQASTVTVGSVLPVEFTSTPFEQVKTQFNTALPEKGANLVSPVNGAVVRWRVQGAKGGPFYLRVLRPNGSGAYEGAGTSLGATPSNTGLQTFTTNLSIRAGDLIGIDPTNGSDEIGIATVSGASFASIFPPPLDGATVPSQAGASGKEIELSAEIQPAPAITSVTPSEGPVTGGTVVTIKGTNLNAASAVKFGTVPAASFAAESETQITAVAPPSTTVGTVDVSATTLAGTSPAAATDRFTYRGCVVPKLKRKSLKTAKRALRNAGCKLGKVSGQRGKRAKVKRQSAKPGLVLAPHSEVDVTLKRPRHHRHG